MEPQLRYPREAERRLVLADGTRVLIRPIRPDDAPRLVALYDRLSLPTAYQRFFTVLDRLPAEWADELANVDYERRLALVAERERASAEVELVGVGRYEPSDEPDTVEVAFVVEDSVQGLGLGRELVTDLVRVAGTRGVRRFRAFVLADNARMLELLEHLTDIRSVQEEDGVVEMTFTAKVGPPAPPR